MNKFEFVKYEPTPNEKHLGIASVYIYSKIIARFKIVPTKDGSAFFPAAPSLKIGDTYVSAFTLDSMSEKEELDNLIKSSVRLYMAGKEAPKATPSYQQTSLLEPDFGNPPF